jgi:hypothetical protein
MPGLSGPNIINGTGGADHLNGGADADVINGFAGDDFLNGGAGDDTLNGGAGSDRVDGDSGSDVLTYIASDNAAGAHDVYDGGSGIDTLRLELTAAQLATPSVQQDVLAFLNFIADHTLPNGQADNEEFHFQSFDLNVSKIEELQFVVPDGVADGFITGHNFFGPAGSPGDLFLIRDIGGVRQLEALQIDNSNVSNAVVFGTVGTNQNFVGSGDFNGDGLSDLLINVDNPATQTRTFLVDQMNPGGIQAQFQIAVRGSDWVVDGVGDFNHNGTDDIQVHRDIGGNRTLEVMVMNNNAVQSNVTIGVNGTNWQVDGIGDFNGDGTSDILQHQISAGSMTLRALSMSPNAVQVQSAPTLGTIGANWQVDGTGDFNHDGTSDILVHQDSSGGVRTLQVLTVQNNAITSATTIAQVGTNISVGGIGDFNGDGTSDIALHQDVGTTSTDLIYNVVNNTVVNPHTVAVTGIDWHLA